MKDEQYFEIAKWASEVAERYNKSITYVVMKIFEARAIHADVELIKLRVVAVLEGLIEVDDIEGRNKYYRAVTDIRKLVEVMPGQVEI